MSVFYYVQTSKTIHYCCKVTLTFFNPIYSSTNTTNNGLSTPIKSKVLTENNMPIDVVEPPKVRNIHCVYTVIYSCVVYVFVLIKSKVLTENNMPIDVVEPPKVR